VHVIYAWLRRHPKTVDGVLALGLALLGVGTGGRQERHPLVPIVLAVAVVVPVVFRRKYPAGAFAAAVVLGGLQVLVSSRPSGSDVAILILLYTLAAYRPRQFAVPGLVICLVGSVIAIAKWAPNGPHTLDAFLSALTLFATLTLIAWVLGDSMRYRRGYFLALEERAARLERERDAQAQIAAAAERARIARELHDVVAHNVSVMVVQADGAAYALDSEPERARQALAAISGTGRHALAEMRRLLGVLRTEDEPTGFTPQPGIDELGELLEQTRATGLAVSFTVEGAARPLPEGIALAAYRVVQESLTNTRKHAGPASSVSVLLRFCEDGLLLRITDDGRGAAAVSDGAGHGLTGMRERVEMYGGTVRAAPRPGGGYQVTARLPYLTVATSVATDQRPPAAAQGAA